MGLLSHIVAYQIGKRRGKRQVLPVVVEQHEGNPQCVNYESFCRGYGSCDGMECNYEHDEM